MIMTTTTPAAGTRMNMTHVILMNMNLTRIIRMNMTRITHMNMNLTHIIHVHMNTTHIMNMVMRDILKLSCTVAWPSAVQKSLCA